MNEWDVPFEGLTTCIVSGKLCSDIFWQMVMAVNVRTFSEYFIKPWNVTRHLLVLIF